MPAVLPWHMGTAPLHITTPLVEPAPSAAVAPPPCRVLYKLEVLQPTGSFKIRGIGALAQGVAAGAARSPHLVSSSGGNAGRAAAYAALRLGCACNVYVPETTPGSAAAAIRALGATVVVAGADWDAADVAARAALASTPGSVYVHPYDAPPLWDGHATMIDEVVAQLGPESTGRLRAVVCSVGGGGLYAGIVRGLRRNGLADVPVVAAETRGADSLAAALRAGERVALSAITSVAKSLGARQVSQQAFDYASPSSSDHHPTLSVVVSDADAVAGAFAIAEVTRCVVEPACGAASAALQLLPDLLPGLAASDVVVVIVCGGVSHSMHDLVALGTSLQD